MTFAATTNAIVYTGAEPVFVDADVTGNMNPDLLEEAFATLESEGKRVKAVRCSRGSSGQSQGWENIACAACDHRYGLGETFTSSPFLWDQSHPAPVPSDYRARNGAFWRLNVQDTEPLWTSRERASFQVKMWTRPTFRSRSERAMVEPKEPVPPVMATDAPSMARSLWVVSGVNFPPRCSSGQQYA